MADKPDPVEIAAKAAYMHEWHGDPDPSQPFQDSCADYWRASARAIISALEEHGAKVIFREPTEEMVKAGKDADWVGEEEGREGRSILPDTDWAGRLLGPGIWAASDLTTEPSEEARMAAAAYKGAALVLWGKFAKRRGVLYARDHGINPATSGPPSMRRLACGKPPLSQGFHWGNGDN